MGELWLVLQIRQPVTLPYGTGLAGNQSHMNNLLSSLNRMNWAMAIRAQIGKIDVKTAIFA